MANANLLAMIANPRIADPSAYYKGAQAGNALSKFRNEQEAQALLPAAMGGDKNALSKLASYDPNTALRLDDRAYGRERDALSDSRAAAGERRTSASADRANWEFERKRAVDRADRVARVLFNADTPVTFDMAIAQLKREGIQFDAGEDVFDNRQTLIDQAMSVDEHIRLRNGGGDTGQERMVSRLMAENPGMTYWDAVAMTRGDRTESSRLRGEEMALTAARDDPQFAIDPEGTINRYRQFYGVDAPVASPRFRPEPSPAQAAPTPAAPPIAPGAPASFDLPPPSTAPATTTPPQSNDLGKAMREVSGMWGNETRGMRAPDRTTEASPSRPSTVPAGSAYSPSRRMWRSPDGRLFDASGQAVQ